MKNIPFYFFALTTVAFFSISTESLMAVQGLGIRADSTNIIVFWPSAGYENYVIQYRPDVNPGTPWTTLSFSTPTNIPDNYPANSTSFTTYTNFGAIPASVDDGGSGGVSQGGPPNPDADGAQRSFKTTGETDSSTNIIYPPLPWDTNNWAKPAAAASSHSLTAEDDFGADDVTNSTPVISEGFYRVFLKPDFWYSYSGYTFNDGDEFLPIYLGVPAQMVNSVQLLVDGVPFRQIQYNEESWNFGTPENPDWEETYGIWFHNDKLTNGTHTLQLVSTLQILDNIAGTNSFLTMTNPPISTTVNNPILFTDWNSLIVGTNATFNAQTTIYPANWEIDLYDQNQNFVNSATGTTSDGNISWTWNLYDANGALRDNIENDPYFIPVVSVSPTSQSMSETPSAPVVRQGPTTAVDYPYKGGWIIGYQDRDQFYPDAKSATFQMANAILGGVQSASLPNTAVILQYGNTNSPDMTTDPVQNMILRNGSWDTLRSQILTPLNRNLYIYAHADGYSMGGDWDALTNLPDGGQCPNGSVNDPNTYQTTNGPISSTAFLSSGWCYYLHEDYSDIPHPYRFVFLDGCSTATGDWPTPFGIDNGFTHPLSYYTASGRDPNTRPSAFVGWKQIIYYSYPKNATDNGWGDYQSWAYFRSEWMFNWVYNGQTSSLSAALEQAQSDSGWISFSLYQQIIAIYGYADLGFNDYNQRSGWPLPQ